MTLLAGFGFSSGVACIGVQAHVGPSYVYFQSSSAVGLSGTYDSDKYATAEKCAYSIFGLVAVGDASIEETARTKGITNVMNVSHVFRFNYGFNQAICTQVRGY